MSSLSRHHIISKIIEKYKFYFIASGRILMGVLFLILGTIKLMNLGEMTDYMILLDVPYPAAAALISGLLITLAGAALISGYHTKIAVIVLIIYMILTTLIFNNPNQWATDPTAQIMLLKNLAITGGLLFMLPFLR